MQSLQKKPPWLKIPLVPSGNNYLKIKKTLSNQGLDTVCQEASCPNLAECWGTGTATIMIMGDTCTRGCKFCNVSTGKPIALDPGEPFRVARAIKEWDLRYVVITSVCRDDLEDDGGADHFARTIKAVKKLSPDIIVEPLIPDFGGKINSLEKILDAKPDIVSHNIETVRRLTPIVRDSRATYDQSIFVLEKIKQINSKIPTKSSIMLGHGETSQEVFQTAMDLRSVGVDVLTAGQYLQPSRKHLAVREFITPARFASYKKDFLRMGFMHVASGPLVRSSFRAADIVEILQKHHVP